MRLAVWMAVACSVLGVTNAQAQTDFTATALRPGNEVRVTWPSGVQITGVVTAIGPRVLTVNGITVEPEQGLRVERSGDSIWNGLAIGIVAGSVLGASIDRRGCFHGVTVPCVAKPGLLFGALGALIDHARVGRTTVFLGASSTSLRLIPMFSSDAKWLLLSLHF